MTESYFGLEVEIISYIEDIQSYLVKIEDHYSIYNKDGEDALGLSTLDELDTFMIKKELGEIPTVPTISALQK